MKQNLKQIGISLAVLAALGASSGCKGESDSAAPVSKKASVDALTASLVSRIPHGAFGFYHWSLSNASYTNLTNSPWKGDSGTGIDASSASSALSGSPAYTAFKEAGLDFADTASMSNTLSEVVLFVSPATTPEPGSNGLDVGGVLAAKPGVDLAQKFSQVRASLQKQNIAATDTTFGTVKGFETALDSASETAEGKPRQFFVAATPANAVIGTSREAVQLTIDKLEKGAALPDIATKETFRALSAHLGNHTKGYATGFVDVERLIEHAKKYAPAEETNNIDNIPVRAGAISSWMDAAPGTDLAFLLAPKNDTQKKVIASLGSPTSEQLLSVVPTAPMLYVSLDGSLFKLGESVMQNDPNAAPSPLKMLEQVRRLVLSVNAAAVGQSLLPIPDITLAIEAANAAEISATLNTLAQASLPGAPGAGPSATEKTIAGTKAQQFTTPFGVSVFLATVNQVVILTTTELQMNAAITGMASRKAVFVDALSASQKKNLVANPNVGALYIDFPQVASFMESISSLTQMYGGQNGQGQPTIGNPEQIAAMKQRGVLTGSARIDGEVLQLNSFYSPKVVKN